MASRTICFVNADNYPVLNPAFGEHYIGGESVQQTLLAKAFRDKGYDVDDPTAETLGQWGADFRVEFDWDDPAAKEAYQECSSAD